MFPQWETFGLISVFYFDDFLNFSENWQGDVWLEVYLDFLSLERLDILEISGFNWGADFFDVCILSVRAEIINLKITSLKGFYIWWFILMLRKGWKCIYYQ